MVAVLYTSYSHQLPLYKPSFSCPKDGVAQSPARLDVHVGLLRGQRTGSDSGQGGGTPVISWFMNHYNHI